MILAFTLNFSVKLREASRGCTLLIQELEVPLEALGLVSLCTVFINPFALLVQGG